MLSITRRLSLWVALNDESTSIEHIISPIEVVILMIGALVFLLVLECEVWAYLETIVH